MADALIVFTGMQLPTLDCLLELAREVIDILDVHAWGALWHGCYVILVGLLYLRND